MAVYVDNMKRRYRTMVMCHMLADTLGELLTMADQIGVQRKWLQTPVTRPHFDICMTKRALAVRHGAIEITMREAAAMSRKRA